MKLLHREDVIEVGYDLPTTGLCASIGEFELEELKFGGEWVLAENEVLVTDGHEQRYLYMLVSGEVVITKKNDQGNSQQIATLSAGAAFGQMAFLSGGVASADVQSLGECILWRIDHERMLEFIGSNGTAGGQLCLNVASILSGRLVDGNKKVVDMGKELQASLAHLQQAASVGTQKDQALRQMQGKVSNMQNAFKGSAVKKPHSNWFAVAASAVALLSTIGLIGMFLASDDSSENEVAGLADKVVKLEANEEFYLGLKKKLEDENKELTKERKGLSLKNESLSGELASNESRSMSDIQGLRDQLSQAKRELSDAKDDIVRAQRVVPVQPRAKPISPVETSKSETEEILAWAKKNTTLVFPCLVKVSGKTITLQDKDKKAQIPVAAGGVLRAMSYHPSSRDFLIVSQQTSNKFLATLPISNSNFAEAIKPKYQQFAKGASRVAKPLANPLAPKPKPVVRLSSRLSSPSPSSEASVPTGANPNKETDQAASVAKGRPRNPQKPENILDSMPMTKPVEMNKKNDLSDHGANCVCKDCRVKKIGKGGSLFPDL
jgi:CRP-like cAMP-binding protein